jgi:hypothetical protein
MSRIERLDIGIIMERRAVEHRWIDHEWVCVGAEPSPPAVSDWTRLDSAEGWVRYHACVRTLELHRRETEDYLANMESRQPAVYVVSRPNEDSATSAAPLLIPLATVSVFQAELHVDNSEDTVHRIAMPGPIAAWIWNFLAMHHQARPFVKRQRDRVRPDARKFGKQPIFETPDPRGHAAEESTGDE